MIFCAVPFFRSFESRSLISGSVFSTSRRSMDRSCAVGQVMGHKLPAVRQFDFHRDEILWLLARIVFNLLNDALDRLCEFLMFFNGLQQNVRQFLKLEIQVFRLQFDILKIGQRPVDRREYLRPDQGLQRREAGLRRAMRPLVLFSDLYERDLQRLEMFLQAFEFLRDVPHMLMNLVAQADSGPDRRVYRKWLSARQEHRRHAQRAGPRC